MSCSSCSTATMAFGHCVSYEWEARAFLHTHSDSTSSQPRQTRESTGVTRHISASSCGRFRLTACASCTHYPDALGARSSQVGRDQFVPTRDGRECSMLAARATSVLTPARPWFASAGDGGYGNSTSTPDQLCPHTHRVYCETEIVAHVTHTTAWRPTSPTSYRFRSGCYMLVALLDFLP